MPTFHVTYFNAKEKKIEEESIFMKNLAAASARLLTMPLMILNTSKSKT